MNLRFQSGVVRFRLLFDGETVAGQFVDLGYAIYSRRCPFNARTNPASAYASSYTVIIGGNDDDSSVPKGDGFATLTIGLDGRAAIRGKLSDGIAFSRSTFLTQDGECPLLLLHGTKEFAVARLGIGQFGDHDIEGPFTWRRTQQSGQRLFAGGFEIAPSVKGFRYQAPTNSQSGILQLTNAVVVIDGGALGIHFTNRITFDSNNKILNESSNSLKISVRATDGTFSGAIKTPASRAITVQGVVAQGQNYASGYFLGSNQCGRVSIHSPPPPLTASIETIYTNTVAAFSNTFTADLNNPGASVVWDFGDGTVVSNQPSVSHAWTALGDYTVTLTAYDEFTPSGVSTAIVIHVLDHVTHYVSQQNTNPVFPFLSWDNSATNIQDAVEAVLFPNSVVLVTNGLYESGTAVAQGSNRIAITQPILLQSMNGPAVTTIKGKATTQFGDGIRCVYLAERATLDGFTLTNGSGGVLCESTNATVLNCVIAGNFAGSGALYSGTAYNCYFYNNTGTHMGEASYCVLNSCTFSNNSAVDGGGAVYSSVVNSCVLGGNSASAGGAALSSTLHECLLVGNSADAGGAAVDCTLNNCILSNNVANQAGAATACILNSCLVLSNSASYLGGGSWGFCTANNCTIVGNASPHGGGAADSTLNNCIVCYNSAPDAPNYGSFNVPMSLNYCCTSPMPTNGVGNLINEPLFVDLAAGDFRLAPGSPCIDAGNNLYATNSFDLNGNPRINNGTVDIGAYEFVPINQARNIVPKRRPYGR
jgi:predicted outer membrane repeat protein